MPKNPYEFEPTPIRQVTVSEATATRAEIPEKGVVPGNMTIDKPANDEVFMANLRQAAVSATRNEIPVGQADMRGW